MSKVKSLGRTHSQFHFVFTTEAGTSSVAWIRGVHSTGLTQNMLTSASLSQKPIKIIVGRIIRQGNMANCNSG